MISLEERIFGLSQIWKTATYNFARWDELQGQDRGRSCVCEIYTAPCLKEDIIEKHNHCWPVKSR